MSRSGYSDDCDDMWRAICWRGAVAASLRGKRGQAFLREMLTALDALPEPKLIANDLVSVEGCCAMGAVALARSLDVSEVDEFDRDMVADLFGIAEAMAAEIADVNDDDVWCVRNEQPEDRFTRVRRWVTEHIIPTPDELSADGARP